MDLEEILVIIIAIVAAICIAAGVNWCVQEYQFSCVKPVIVEAYLLNSDYTPSTRSTHVAPIFNGKGQMSCAVYTTGHGEITTTIWDCGQFGRLVSTDEKIYRLAREKSMLLIRHSDYDTRIVGIVDHE